MEDLAHIATPKTGNGITIPVTVLGIFLCSSVFMNVLLGRKLSAMRVEKARLSASMVLQTGASVPRLTGHAVDGSPMEVRYEDAAQPTVLYVFSPQCRWCAKNLDNFKSLIAQAGQSYRVIGLSMTRQDLASYLSREHLNVPVFADVDSTIVSAYQLSATPTTIVVSPSAKVLKVWTGAYQEGTRQEIETFLAVHLLPCCENNP